MCYSADGEYVIAGGNSRFVNLYNIRSRLLVKKYSLTSNRSLDGILMKLNTKGIKDGKVLAEIDDQDHSDYEVSDLSNFNPQSGPQRPVPARCQKARRHQAS